MYRQGCPSCSRQHFRRLPLPPALAFVCLLIKAIGQRSGSPLTRSKKRVNVYCNARFGDLLASTAVKEVTRDYDCKAFDTGCTQSICFPPNLKSNICLNIPCQRSILVVSSKWVTSLLVCEYTSWKIRP